MQRTLNVVLPWPCRSLHPNARVHWAKRARAAKSARWYAYCSTRSTGIKLSIAGRIDVTVKAHVPDRRRRDMDGVLSACKPYFDGIADAIGVDDSNFDISIHAFGVTPGGVIEIIVGHYFNLCVTTND